MVFLLAQLEAQNAAEQWFTWVSLIMVIGAVAVLLVVVVGVARRWKHRQLEAIEQDRAKRRAGQSAERVDAWQASSERYIDRDKLSPDEERYRRNDDAPGDAEDSFGSSDDANETPISQDDRDPFDLFADKPYQEADDDDDDDEDWDDDDWDEEDDDDDEADKR